MRLRIQKGFDLPIEGVPVSSDRYLDNSTFIGMDFRPFLPKKLKPLVKEDQLVKIGEPIAEFLDFGGNYLVSPASGKIRSIKRGEKRVLVNIVIEKEETENFFDYPQDTKNPDENNIISFLGSRGLLAHFSARPFGLPVNPNMPPKKVFINFSENMPFLPPYTEQIKCLNNLKEITEILQAGINWIRLIIPDKPELVYRKENQNLLPDSIDKLCNLSLVTGPYPSGECSVHIHKIYPIQTTKDTIWTITFYDVMVIGYMALTNKYLNQKIIGFGGTGFLPEDRLFVKVQTGSNINTLIEKKYFSDTKAIITGSPLTGRKITGSEEFLGFRDLTISCFPINSERKSFYFMRPGLNEYTLTNTYLYKMFHTKTSPFAFTTNVHGETRSFIDAELYNRFMPMKIPVIPLIKSILSEDFEQAIRLGFLEIIPEDFALSSFICPSKNDFINIVKNGIETFLLQEV